MKDLIQIIDGIAKYGLMADLEIKNKEEDLEQLLVLLYAYSFRVEYKFEDQNYPAFNKKLFPNVIDNVQKNFPSFGFYHSILNLDEISADAETGTGDAVDDLSDIIYDILQIKWRIENNSEADGLRYFKLIFDAHTQQHLIDLLNFMKVIKG